MRRDPLKSAPTIRKGTRSVNTRSAYTGLLDSCDRRDAMATTLRLPRADGTLTSYRLAGAPPVAPPTGPIRSRLAYAAVHVVADPLARISPMASRALAACARGGDDYAKVYGRILTQAREPVIIHWLGEMFDPALAGYWGSRDLDQATETLLAIVAEHAPKIDGVKISLLDQQREIAMRRRFPRGVRMYSGDDFDYPTTIRGDAQGASDALLGIFDVIAPAASAALHALDGGDLARYGAILAPTLPLSRHVFGAPTRFYKTGVVFAAYLNGHQSGFKMVGGLESARSVVHLAEQFVLLDRAGLLRDPALAAQRMRAVLAVAGVA